MDQQLGKTIMKSSVWKILERFGVQGSSFIVQIILARILMPEDFGKFTIILTFVSIGTILVECGFGTALIQRKELAEIDIRTNFSICLCNSIMVATLIFISSSAIQDFYSMEGIMLPLKIVSGTLIIGSYNSVLLSLATRELKFNGIFIANFLSAILSAIIGIVFALIGYGIWALIIQYVTNICVSTFILSIVVKWFPKFGFSYQSAKTSFSFGWKLLMASAMNRLYIEIYNLIIGKFFSARALGIYTRGKTFPYTIEYALATTIESVMLPFFSQRQDDLLEIKQLLRSMMRLVSFIACPILLGLAAVSKPLTIILLTEKWIEIIPIFIVFCFGYALAPISSVNLMAINGVGRSDLYLKLEVIKRFVGVVILLITMKYGVLWISIGLAFSIILNIFINSVPNKKLFNYSIVDQLKDILPSYLLAVIMFVCVYCFDHFFNNNNCIFIVLETVMGILIYLVPAYLIKLDGMVSLLNIIKKEKKIED